MNFGIGGWQRMHVRAEGLLDNTVQLSFLSSLDLLTWSVSAFVSPDGIPRLAFFVI